MRAKVLVLGSFRRTEGDDRIGGQSFACHSLVNSQLAEHMDFRLVDSTLRTIRPGSSLYRLPTAMARFLRCLWQLRPGGARSALCFAAAGASFVEKGCLVMLGGLFGRKMILLPRSGPLQAQIDGNAWFRGFARLVILRAHRLVCQSESWRSYYRDLVPQADASKFVVIENWLPESAFVEPEARCAGAGAGAADRFLVGYMSRIEAPKGVFDFIEAVRLAHARDPSIRGVIYGDGGALAQVQAMLAEPGLAGVIDYGGWLDGDAKVAALRGLDAYLFASHAEGFPNALLEVLALKVPVVSVRVGAVVDLLEHRASALLANIGDARALSENLLAYAHDPRLREAMAEQAYRRVRARNALPSAIAAFRELLA